MTEREFKFKLPERLDRASASPRAWSTLFDALNPDDFLTLGSWQERDMHALYYDTVDRDLSRRLISLRLREEADVTRLTIKRALDVDPAVRGDGLARRLEWEKDTDLSLEPCPSAAELKAEIEALLEEHGDQPDAARQLEPLPGAELSVSGEVHFKRREILLENRSAPLLISWSVDRGELRAHGSSRPLAETEFELLEGDPSLFDRTVGRLAASLELQPLLASKDQRLRELAIYGLVIVGGGPAGLTAAIAAREANPSLRVLLLERMDSCGRKLNATGNGRGNISHTGELAAHYHSVDSSGEWIRAHTDAWDSRRLCEWFAAHGLPTAADENGRIYPLSRQAGSVTRLLTGLAEQLGVEIRAGSRVSGLRCLPGRRPLWRVETADGSSVLSEQVVVAAGGSAQPNLGSDGSGLELLRGLGLGVTPIYPALVQLACAKWPKRLSGIRLPARLTACGQSVSGELLLTDYGLSGIVSLELSLLCAKALAGGGALGVEIDLVPRLDREDVMHMLLIRRQVLPGLSGAGWADGIVPAKLAAVLAEQMGIEGWTLAGLDPDQAGQMADLLKRWPVTVTGTRGLQYAQVSLGGLRLDQLEAGSCAVRCWPGLYVCGEALDLTGETGGYNLHLALTSGLACGDEAGQALK